MSDYKQKDDSGILFKNTYKEEGSKQPDYKGNIMIKGHVFKLAAWIGEATNGNKYLSIKVDNYKPEEKKDDDVPF